MIHVEKIVEVIVGLVFLYKGQIAFGCTLIVFGLTNITFNLKK